MDRGGGMVFDLVIRNGTVVDGSGRARFRADVGIVGDCIATIGRVRERGREEIDAEGQVVAPGFIEVHSHMDAQVFWDALGTSPAWHGVTTTLMGNCGFTLAPCRESEMDLCLRSLERAEDMSREVLRAGIRWSWETFAEYLDVVDRLPKGINYAGYLGHSALRTYVMGERAYDVVATGDDLAALCRGVEVAMRAGAIGFSTSRSPAHRTPDDRPVASRVADWSEVHTLVGAMAATGAGVFEITPDATNGDHFRRERLVALGDLAVQTGRPVSFILANAPHYGDAWLEMLDLVDATVARGGRMTIQALSRQVQSLLSFRTQLPFDRLPTWSDLRRRPLAEQRRALEEPVTRGRLVQEAMSGPYRNSAAGPEARPPDWDILAVYDSPLGPYRSVGDLARARGTTPVDVMVDLALATDMAQFFVQPYANHDLRDVLRILSHPAAVVGGSDSGAHVSQIVDSSMPTFMLAHWVRRERAFTLEQAVRKLTFEPALVWELRDRGLVAPGRVADLVVFDPERIAPAMPVADADLPGGGKRLKQGAVGIAATVVAGQVLLRDGEHTGNLPGRLLRGAGYQSTH